MRYLSGLGFDTHLTRHGDADWNEAANAGFEDLPFANVPSEALPYVVKSPWLHEYMDEILARGTEFQVDAVLIPIRPLDEVAASRVVLELRALHERFPWMVGLERSWEHWGGVAGGSVFSLNPLDQARVLAVGFHRLIERLIRADIPLVLLDFPRFALDADYLYNKLVPVLPMLPSMDQEQAREVHRVLVDVSKIRIRAELDAVDSMMTSNGTARQSLEALDRVAIRRELTRLRGLVATHTEKITSIDPERDKLQAELTMLLADNDRLRAEIARTAKDLTAVQISKNHEGGLQKISSIISKILLIFS